MKPTFQENGVEIYQGDCREVLRSLPDESVNCCVTSPPYWGLRDYGCEGQIGLEDSPVKYIATMREVFAEVRRVLRSDGTLWLNMGDSYCGASSEHKDIGSFGKNSCISKKTQTGVPMNGRGERTRGMSNGGLKPKDLVGIPWMLAFALREDGWYLRQDIIWSKPNPMPESVTDRCTKAHEYIFLLSKSERYYFNQEAILEACSLSTHARLSQDVQNQIGSERVPGKTNGNMKAVGRQPQPNWNGSDFSSQRKRDLHPNIGRKMAEPGNGIKNNSSFDEAMAIMPEKRNRRSVWEVTTQPFPEAHFATFPEDLIKPCILAGCPDKCCGKCGAPFVNVTESQRVMRHELPKDNPNYRPARYTRKSDGRDDHANGGGQAFKFSQVLGSEPSCACYSEPLDEDNPPIVSGVVLDPFGGSGTTAKVARDLNCKAILVELNPDYIQIAARRLSQHVFNFAENRAGGVAPPEKFGDRSLP